MFKKFVKKATAEAVQEAKVQINKEATSTFDKALPFLCAAGFVIGYFVLREPVKPTVVYITKNYIGG